MDKGAAAQLRVIKAVTNALGAAGISAWLFGGWGLDARIGRITREHGDIEFWLERLDAERSKAVLVGAGATALTTQPPAEACEFTLEAVPALGYGRAPGGFPVRRVALADGQHRGTTGQRSPVNRRAAGHVW